MTSIRRSSIRPGNHTVIFKTEVISLHGCTELRLILQLFFCEVKKRSFIQNQDIDRLSVRQEPYNDTDDVNMKRMYEAIHQLSPIDKALIFFFLEGFSGKDIAVQLGITEVNTRVKLKRAKENLKRLLPAKIQVPIKQ